MLKVVLSGYFGFGNLGDEALLAGELRILRAALPDARLVVLSNRPEETAVLHGVAAVPRNLRHTWRELRRAGLLVVGGGSLLQDVTSARSLLYYLAVMAMARLSRVDVAWLAHGIGPIRRRWLRRLVGAAARAARLVSVRDAGSRRALERLGLPAHRVHVVADPAWVLAPGLTGEDLAGEEVSRAYSRGHGALSGAVAAPGPRHAQSREDGGAAAGNVGSGKRLLVAWRSWRGARHSPRQAGRALGRALARCGVQASEVAVVPFHPDADTEDALAVAGGIQDGAGAEGVALRVRVCPLPPAPAEALLAVRGFDLVIGVRLHALLFAAAAGVPFVAVAYDPKVEGLLEELQWPVPGVAPEEVGQVGAWVDRLQRAVTIHADLTGRLAQVGPLMAKRAARAGALLAEAVAPRRGAATAVTGAAVAAGPDAPAEPETAIEPETVTGPEAATGPAAAAETETPAGSAGVSHAAAPKAVHAAGVSLPPEPPPFVAAPVLVLGVPVHPVKARDAAAVVSAWAGASPPSPWLPPGGGPWVPPVRHVVTLNPEMVMLARRDPVFASVLRQADLVVPDGIGVVWAGRTLGLPIMERVPGIELAERVMAQAARHGTPVFLLGGRPAEGRRPGVADEAARRLASRNPGLVISGTHHGYFRDGSAEEQALLAAIQAARPGLLLVGMGFRRQELWIARHRARLAGCAGVAIGVGGALDVWACRTRRAPILVRRLGVEWLFRLLLEPRRRARRVAALPAFAAWVIAQRYSRPGWHGPYRRPRLDGRREEHL